MRPEPSPLQKLTESLNASRGPSRLASESEAEQKLFKSFARWEWVKAKVFLCFRVIGGLYAFAMWYPHEVIGLLCAVIVILFPEFTLPLAAIAAIFVLGWHNAFTLSYAALLLFAWVGNLVMGYCIGKFRAS